MVIRCCPEKVHSHLAKYSQIHQLTEAFLLSDINNGQLFVPDNGLKDYGQSLSDVCEAIATTYKK
jgi:hypothetical protein